MLRLKKSRVNPYAVVLVCILAINAYLKWKYFYGLVMADDFSYGVYAFRLFRQGLPWDMSMDFRTLRLTLLLPVAVLFKLFPPNEFVAVIYPMTASFGTIILVYLIGKKLVSPKAGIFSAFIYATFPTDIRAGTLLLPGMIVTFFLSLAVLLFLYALEDKGRRAKILYLLTGLAVFIAFNARENSYYFLLFFLPFAFNKARWENGMYLIGAGFAAPVIMLYTFYFIKTGDFLYNLRLAEKYRDPLIASGYIPENSTNWYMLFYYIFPEFFGKIRGGRGFINPIFGINFVLGVPFIVYVTLKSIVKRDWKTAVIPWWFLIAYLYQEFGSISFSQYQMMRKLSRFLLLLTPALALGYGVIFYDIARKIRKRAEKYRRLTLMHVPTVSIMGVLLILHLFSLLFVLMISRNNTNYSIRKYRWAYYRVLEDRPVAPIYLTGGWWRNKLAYYYLPDERFADVEWDRSEMLRDLTDISDSSELAGAYVLIDRTHFSGQNDLGLRLSYENLGQFVRVPPEEWDLLASGYNVEIYKVPETWVYQPVDEKQLVLESFKHSLKVGDLMLAIQNLHPDFLGKFEGADFREFIDSIIDLESQYSMRMFSENVEFRKFGDNWKILFILE